MFEHAADLEEVRDRLTQHLTAEPDAPEQTRWRLGALARALAALAHSETLSDRGIWLREATRLSNQVLALPFVGLGLDKAELPSLVRFGLSASLEPGPPEVLCLALLNEGNLPEGLLPALAEAVRLDPQSRRPFPPAPPDGALLRLSGHRQYQNPTQKSGMRALLTMPPGASLLVTMPTGSGKSLFFELGVRWWQAQTTDEVPVAVVIVPTVSLALSHVETMRFLPGLERSEALIGDMGPGERERVLQAFARGEIPLLFMAPEAAFGAAREGLLKATLPREERVSAARGRLAGVFIDEAHIIESWGRSFRPDFQRLRGWLAELRCQNPDVRTILLSATVSEEAAELLRTGFGGGSAFLEISAQVPRYEFDLVVQKAASAAQRDARVIAAADRLPRPALIYTTERAHADRLFQSLHDRGYERIAVFTGDTKDKDRRRIVRAWRKGEIDLVVATSAFGMGVDKADVRAVVHACLPEDASRYYQEIGRAARDGHQAVALCLWTDEDAHDAENLATGQLLTVEVASERWLTMLADGRSLAGLDHTSMPGKTVMRVPINATPSRLLHEGGKHNRRWNRALLNMLQRAGALEVTGVAESGAGQTQEVWTLLINEPRILDAGPDNEAYLAEVLELRETEKAQSRRRVKEFIRVLTEEQEFCVFALLFEQVEAGAPLVPPCGRCRVCRNLGMPPPGEVAFQGLEAAWEVPAGSGAITTGPGPVVVHPDEHLQASFASILEVLARLGVRQFVVPDGWGERTAEVLKAFEAHPGLVMEAGALLEGAWQPARLPSAVVIAPEQGRRWQAESLALAVRERFDAWPEQSLVWVVPPEFRVGGRPFAQIAGAGAPLDEAGLRSMSQGVLR